MNELLKKFLNDIGVSEDMLGAFTAETPAEDFDYDQTLETYRNDQAAVYKKRLKPEIDQEVNSRMTNLYGTIGRRITSKLNFEHEDQVANKEGLETLLTALKKNFDTQISEAATKENKEILVKLNAEREKQTELKDQLDKWQEKYDTDLEIERKRADEKIARMDLDKVFASEFKKIKWGVAETQREVYERDFRRQIEEKYKVSAEQINGDLVGTVLDKDGNGKAVNFLGTGSYTMLSEPIAFLASKHEVIQMSNGGDGDPPNKNKKQTVRTTDGMSDHAKAMKARIEKARMGR